MNKQDVEAAMNLRDRGEALIDILRITVREELRQEYKLDLGEMYLLMDYTSHLRECIDNQRATIQDMMGFKASDYIERIPGGESDPT